MFSLHNIWWIKSGVHVTVTASGFWKWWCSQSVMLFVCMNIPCISWMWSWSVMLFDFVCVNILWISWMWSWSVMLFDFVCVNILWIIGMWSLPPPLLFFWTWQWLAFIPFAPCSRVWLPSIVSLVWSSFPIPETWLWAVLEVFSSQRRLALVTRCIVGWCQNTTTASGFWTWSWSVMFFICVKVPWMRSTVPLPFPWIWTRAWSASMLFSPCPREWRASMSFPPCVRVWWTMPWSYIPMPGTWWWAGFSMWTLNAVMLSGRIVCFLIWWGIHGTLSWHVCNVL